MRFFAVSALVLIYVTLSLAQGFSRTDVSFKSFSDKDIHGGQLTAIYGPKVDGGKLILTDKTVNDAGIVWFNSPQYLLPGFSTEFSFVVTNPDKDKGGMDGLAFIIQSLGTTASGRPGAGIGYADDDPQGTGGIRYSLALEFDTFQDAAMADPDNNHISLHSMGPAANNASELAHLNISSAIPNIKSGNVQSVKVTYDGTTLSVYYGSTTVPVMTAAIDLNRDQGSYFGINRNSGRSFVGFSASTGAGFEQQAIVSWALTQNFGSQIDATKSYATGDGLSFAKAGVYSTFKVFLVDKFGYPAGYSPATPINATLSDGTQVIIQDNKDGTYDCKYNTTNMGAATLTVTYGGVNIIGSAFSVTVRPGPAYGPNCVASGPGLTNAVSGVQTNFVVATYDIYGNRITNGTGDVFSAKFKPDVSSSSSLTGGDWTTTYTALPSGTYTVSVSVNGRDIKNSPFQVTVVAGPVNGTSSTISGLSSGKAGDNNTFTIQARDTYGNLITVGGATWDVSITVGSVAVPVSVVDLGNGQYKATWNVTKAGKNYPVSVALHGGAPVKGSPFSVDVHPNDPYAPNCYSEGDDRFKNGAGNVGKFTIQAVDFWGNKLDHGSSNFGAVAVGDTGSKTSLKITDNKDGSYTAAYQLTKIGNYKLNVFLGSDQNPIRDSPYALVIVPGVPYAPNCRAVGHAIVGGEAGDELPVMIYTYDRYGNQITQGGYALAFSGDLSGPLSRHLSFRDLADGRYEGDYNVTKSGAYSFSIKYNGDHISQSPFQVSIVAGPIYYKTSILTTPVLETFAYEELTVTILARDRFGNPRTNGDGGEFTAAIDNGEVRNFRNNDDGTWSFEVYSEAVGYQPLHVYFRNRQIGDVNSYFVRINNGRADASHCVAFTENSETGALLGAVAGETGYFYVQANDAGGHPVDDEDITWAIVMTGPENIIVEATYLRDGIFECQYTAHIAGRYVLEIDLAYSNAYRNGAIYNSPQTPLVIAGHSWLPNAVAYGHHLHNAEAHENAVFWISTKDYYQNQVTIGGEYFNVMIKGPDCQFANQTDYYNGTYAFSYRVSEPGKYEIHINNRGRDISGSAFDLTVTEGGNSSGSSGLSAGAIAGIVIGCVVGVLILIVAILLVVFIMRRNRSQLAYESVS